MKCRGTDSAKVIQVIETKALKGDGTQENPARIVIKYRDLDGNLLAERDNYELDKNNSIEGKS